MMMSSVCLVSKWNSYQLKRYVIYEIRNSPSVCGVTFPDYYVTKKACRARALLFHTPLKHD